MTGPLVSVVVPTAGNRQAYLEEAVDSVLTQGIAEVEVVVVDDSGMCAVRDGWDQRVRVVRRPAPGGIAAARNTGMEAATGCYLAFLDDDDRYLPDRLANALSALERADFALCWLVDSKGNHGPQRRLEGDIADEVLDDFTPQPGTVTGRRERFPRFDEALVVMEDVEWWIRLGAAGTFTTTPTADYWYRIHDEPRVGYATAERVSWRRHVLAMHEPWFRAHRRALGFQLLRIGVQERSLGRRAEARRALVSSLRVRPTARAARQLAATFVSAP